MFDEKGNATTATTWRDNHSGRRGHKLMTKELADTIPPLYANDGADDPDAVVARVELFSPYNGWRWYITEWDPETGTCFGLVEGFETELGYFDLTELAEVTVFGSVPAVERDLYWEPTTLGEIRRQSRLAASARVREDPQRGETMRDETGTETTRSDAPSADENPLADAADSTAAAVADEQDADEETAQEPQGSDDAEEQAGSSEDLKVVVSLKGGRATIGVQQPSSDPYIESFDDQDLSGLTQEVSAVIERARAKWEDELRYPAHARPAPPARRQARRGQGSAQASTAEGAADQQQPETLRLF